MTILHGNKGLLPTLWELSFSGNDTAVELEQSQQIWDQRQADLQQILTNI